MSNYFGTHCHICHEAVGVCRCVKQPSAGVGLDCDTCHGIGDITIFKGNPPEAENIPCPECSKLSPKPPAINWPEKLNDECTGHEDGICNCDFGYVNGWNACLSACKEAVKQAGLN